MNELDITGLLRALAVGEAGSFAEAARRLGVSRQAVHRSVDALEATLGAPLFDRGGHRVHATSLGRALLKHAEGLREVERAVRDTLAQMSEAPSGLVRLATPPVLGEVVLAPALIQFAQAWPAVRLQVRSGSRQTDLTTEGYDLVIRVGAAPPDGHFGRLLGHASLVLCATPAYLAKVQRLDAPAQLAGLRLLEYGPRRSTEWGFSCGSEVVTVDVDVVLSADSASLLIDACLADLGILRVPALAVREHIERGRLVPVLTAWEMPRAEVWAIYGHRSAADPTLAALLEALRQSFGATAHPPDGGRSSADKREGDTSPGVTSRGISLKTRP